MNVNLTAISKIVVSVSVPNVAAAKEPTGCTTECPFLHESDCKAKSFAKVRKNFELDIEEIADSLMKIMRICGLKPWVVKLAKRAIMQSLKHYGEIRFRVDRLPRKRFCKEDFMHALSKEAGMSRTDCQLAYSITKRAFRAYYHGTGLRGKRLKYLAKRMEHRQECVWLHAAKRTAEIYAAYAGLSYAEQLLFEERIECVYSILYESLQSRIIYEDFITCRCHQRKGQEIKSSEQSSYPLDVLFVKESTFISRGVSAMSVTVEHTYVRSSRSAFMLSHEPSIKSAKSTSKVNSDQTVDELQIKSSKASILSRLSDKQMQSTDRVKKRLRLSCLCPHLQCAREFSTEIPEITAECSQGPYICRWLPYEAEFAEHRVPCPPMEVICEPCYVEQESPCDPNCTCNCEFCHCEPLYVGRLEEEHHGEKLSSTGIEDKDTDFTYIMPFCDTSREHETVEEEEQLEEEHEVALEEAAPYECPCTCEHKQRAEPHLFTYVGPFKDNSEEPLERVEQSDEIEDKPKLPPWGISGETYRCWNKSSSSELSEQPETANLPRLTVLSAAQTKLRKSSQNPNAMGHQTSAAAAKVAINYSRKSSAAKKKSTVATPKPAEKPKTRATKTQPKTTRKSTRRTTRRTRTQAPAAARPTEDEMMTTMVFP